MKKLILPILILCVSASLSFAQTVNITFEVNAATLGTSISADGLFIAGGAEFGSPGDNPMTDMGNGIWSVTIAKPVGTASFYTTLNGNCPGWGCKEQLSGLPCGDPANYNDRWMPAVYSDTTIKTCFGTCDSDGSCTLNLDSVDITFELNTASLSSVDPAGIFLAGGGTFGSPGDNPMTDMGNGMWSITVRKAKGFNSDYVFTNGNSGWGDKEVLTGLPCAFGQYDDRRLPAVYSDTTLKACFATCDSDGSCAGAVMDLNVTFGVDLSSLPAATLDSMTSVNIFGSFNGWNNMANPLTNSGGNVWTTTIPLSPNTDSIEYKFFVHSGWDGNANVEESLTSGDDCTITAGNMGQFVNRIGAVADTIQPAYCWNVCDACGYTNVNGVQIDENLFQLNPSLVRNYTNITFASDVLNKEKQVLVTNALGQVISAKVVNDENIHRIETANFANGLYFVTVKTENVILTRKFVVSK